MELILWRHAEAEDPRPGMSDYDRALTSRGEKQAKDMAHWLRAHLPKHCRILASPAKRTQQTAQALRLAFATEPAIGTGASPADLLRVAGWPDADDTVVLVGHQPTLGQTAALLLTGGPLDWTFQKAGIWWMRVRLRCDQRQVVVVAVHTPIMLMT